MKTLLFTLSLLILSYTTQAQSLTTQIGSRTELGLFGGVANDLSFSSINARLFAAVNGPASLYYSDDLTQSWQPAFPLDSLSHPNSPKGWGGGVKKVLCNETGWVLAKTKGLPNGYNAAVISYDNGYSFQTAMDTYQWKNLTTEMKNVNAIELVDSAAFVAMGNYLLKIDENNEATIVLNTENFFSSSFIISVAASNTSTGLPIYLLISTLNDIIGIKYDGSPSITVTIPPNPNEKPANIFTHHGALSGDTLFYSFKDLILNKYFLNRSTDGGQTWFNISPTAMDAPLDEAIYFPSWASIMPMSQGLRLSFPSGWLSDDLGDTWSPPSPDIRPYGIASSPYDPYTIIASNSFFVLKSTSGIMGSFQRESNFGYHNFSAYDIALNTMGMYIATDIGLAYTSQYYNNTIPEEQLWNGSNGEFPIQSLTTLGIKEITAVAMNPTGSEVICGGPFGFAVKNGPTLDFIISTPSNWNEMGENYDYTVTDIQYIPNLNIVIATTGKKHIKLNAPFPPQIGNIWISYDGGMNWQKTTPFPYNEFSSGNTIHYDPMNNIIYVGSGINEGSYTQEGALWSSTDGTSWMKQPSPISPLTGVSVPIYDIEKNIGMNNDFYYAADDMLLYSPDGGFSFIEKNIPSHLGIVSSILFQNSPDTLKVGLGNTIANYLPLIDDADIPFVGYPTEYTYSLTQGSLLGASSFGASKTTSAPTYTLDIDIFFEGAFNSTTSQMDTTLNSSGYIPLTQPFNEAPWNYNGSEKVSTIPNTAIVDWILVEMRITTGDYTTATKDKAVNRQAGFLLKDGSIVDTDGITPLRFSRIIGSSKDSQSAHAKLIVKRHTHGRTTSPFVIDETTKTLTYDYTGSAGSHYGGVSVSKQLASGIYGLVAGDADGDGYINNADKNDYWVPENGNTGYYKSDFNMDGTVDTTDLDNYWKVNVGLGIGDL